MLMAIDPFFGSVLGAASSVLGGIVGGESTRKANETAQDNFNAQLQFQKNLAASGVTWKAQDIMRAYQETGIHPLALLGVQGPTYTPMSTAFTPSPLGESIGRAGQDISRGIHATADRELRQQAINLQEVALANNAKRGELENQLLALRIQSERMRLAGQTTPARPAPGTSENEIMFPGVEKSVFPDVGVARTPRGGYVVLPSKEAQSRMEEIFGLGPEWWARNRAWLATPEARQWVQKFLPKPGYSREWQYHAPTGEWLPNYLEHGDWHTRRSASAVESLRRSGKLFEYMHGGF